MWGACFRLPFRLTFPSLSNTFQILEKAEHRTIKNVTLLHHEAPYCLPRTSFSRKKNKMASAVAGRLTPVLHRKSLQLLPGPSRPKSAPSPASRASADPGVEPRQIRPNSGSACAQNLLQSPKCCRKRTEHHSVVVSDIGSPSSRRFSQYTSGSPFFAGR
jgi:hypothetical protein